MENYEEVIGKLIGELGRTEFKEGLNSLYCYAENKDKGELHKANDIFTTLIRDLSLRYPALKTPTINFFVNVYIAVLYMDKEEATAYVQQNIANNMLD